MTDKLSKKQRSYNMSRIKGKNTNPELILKNLLKKKGYKFSSVKLFGSPDIVLRRKKIAIFVDGCFWHKCRKHYVQPKTKKFFWKQKINRNIKRDKIVNRTLRKDGWKVIRIWEHKINSYINFSKFGIKNLFWSKTRPQWKYIFLGSRFGLNVGLILINRFGENKYKGLYSLIALVGLLITIYDFGRADFRPKLWRGKKMKEENFKGLLVAPMFL